MLEFLQASFKVYVFSAFAAFAIAGSVALYLWFVGKKQQAIFAGLVVLMVGISFAVVRQLTITELIQVAAQPETLVSVVPESAGSERAMLTSGLENIFQFRGQSRSNPTNQKHEFAICDSKAVECHTVTFARDSEDSDVYWVKFSLKNGNMSLGFFRATATGLNWE
ncbi:hypothetical protein EY643_05250 [Halioglobus maricola]|uniref:Uncharacterized protein n=1 Tax=Halioglobus maricola TaxID=2601894 RepID=A0A5P9NH34_9GAMM|nr:hypothetical protein [Halioglobus maricola]QFU75101.1 hypothetical protein EY643_05250 [Halioglobus maricola]